jgi:pheromone shutdown-related protein TraB
MASIRRRMTPTPEPMPSSVPAPAVPGEVLQLAGRSVRLLGTAHISATSCAEVEQAIQATHPDVVLVELDAGRLENLRSQGAWAKTDIRQVLREGKLPNLIAGLVLNSYQRRMGGETGVRPGSELLRAVEVAEAAGIRVVLCDRPIRSTMRRIWGSVGWWRRMQLLAALGGSLIGGKRMSEAELGQLRQPDTMNAMLAEMGDGLPQLAEVLVHERDRYMAEVIQATEGASLLAVVGAAHVPGMSEALRTGRRSSLAELEADLVTSWATRLLPWLLSLLIVAAIAVVVAMKWNSNATDVLGALRVWILWTSGPALIAGLIARAHPAVLLLIALVAPVAALLRAIPGPKLSLLAASAQAWLRPPTVADMERAADDLAKPSAWWSNRLLRIVLVFILPGLASTLGALWALSLIARG